MWLTGFWGIGDSLMKNSLSWMDIEGALAKIVEVGEGNEQAIRVLRALWVLAQTKRC